MDNNNNNTYKTTELITNNNNNDNQKAPILTNSNKNTNNNNNSESITVVLENENNNNNNNNNNSNKKKELNNSKKDKNTNNDKLTVQIQSPQKQQQSNTNNNATTVVIQNSAQLSSKLTASEVDSRCNTVDNQSDIARYNNDDEDDDDENKDPFPGFVEKSLFFLTKKHRIRYWCLSMITSPWFERLSMLVILINCLTLGMYQPCEDNPCVSTKCVVLQYCDHVIYAFFTVEMTIKIIAMGFIGKDTYLADTWNRLDLFIVIAGTVEYIIATENLSLSAIRTVRVLRPLRAINRVPSMRILVMLLLDTLPMLGNVLLLCFFVFFIFGIVGVQLWKGVLRHRCILELNVTKINLLYGTNLYLPEVYKPSFQDSFICTAGGGMSTCSDIPPYVNNSRICNGTLDLLSTNPSLNDSCINWNMYYTICDVRENPFRGAISFDNIGYAWVAIFQIISLESWVTIMYYIQDAHSFWDWIYFVFLIVIGSFFMINLCLVVIATQFSETKKRETERMIAERRRFSRSNSTIFSDTDPGSCWEELIKYIIHLIRKARRYLIAKHTNFIENRRKLKLDNNNNINNTNETIITNEIPLRNNICKKPATLYLHYHHHHHHHHFHYQPQQQQQQANNSDAADEKDKYVYTTEDSKLNDYFNISAPRASPEITDIGDNSFVLSSSNSNNALETLTQTQSVLVGETTTTATATTTNNTNTNNLNLGSTYRTVSLSRTTSIGKTDIFKDATPELLAVATAKNIANASVSTNLLQSNQIQKATEINNNNDSEITNVKIKKEHSVNFCQDELDEADIENLPQKSLKRSKKSKKQVKLQNDIESENKCCKCWNKFRKLIKRFVNTKLFIRGILGAILINTLSMGVEHHDQPAELTQIVEYSNYIFTTIFLIEMILKLLADGILNYIKNAYNVFDGVIVGLSVYELAKNFGLRSQNDLGNSGVSVLRTFRLLRILKLVRFMPALRRQLIVMLKTIDNVATFFSLLILFMFIFSILGMNIFGCKFCVMNEGVRICERKNFDSLLWSIITVFQVLTQEDWNEVLYNGMEKTSSWASLYFIALMTFGNYVLFNLLVAILVEGFSTEDETKEQVNTQKLNEIDDNEDSVKTNDEASEPKNNKEKAAQMQAIPQIAINCVNNEEATQLINRRRISSPQNSNLNVELITDRINRQQQPLHQQQPYHHHHHRHHNHPPIITHTGPTPIQTPSNSSSNSPLQSKRYLSQDKCYDKMSIQRKLSLDSASDRMARNTQLKNYNKKQSGVVSSEDNKLFEIMEKNQQKTVKSSENIRKLRKSSSPVHGTSSFNETNKLSVYYNQERPAKSKDNSLVNKYTINTSYDRLSEDYKDGSKQNKSSLKSVISNISYNSNDRLTRRYSLLKDNNEFEQKILLNNQIKDNLNNSNYSSKTSVGSSVNQKFKSNSFERHSSLAEQRSALKDVNNSNNGTQFRSSSEIHTNSNNVVKPNHLNEQINPPAEQKPNQTEKKIDQNSINHNSYKPNRNMFSISRKPLRFLKAREDYSLFILPKESKIRLFCHYIICQKWFDYTILLFIALNCITLAMERPSIPPNSLERKFLTQSNYVFSVIFTLEMLAKVLAKGFFIGEHAYMKSGWNVIDGSLVIVSLIDIIVVLSARSSPKIFGILRVFRLLRTLRPLRVISRAPGLKLVVQTLLSSLRPIGNIVLICCTFFIIFGILGVQLFKGKFYHCVGEKISAQKIKTKEDCLKNHKNSWVNPQYNFDNLGSALMALFVLSSKDGWVQIMYTGIDAVGVNRQPIENYNEWMLLYFISFLLLVGFFVLNMFVGVVVENFHKCREEQEREEKARRAAKRAKKFEEKRRKMKEIPYYANYSKSRRFIHDLCNSKYFDLIIAGVIGLNVVTMSVEFFRMPKVLDFVLDIFNYVFTFIFLVEAIMRLIALGFFRYIKEKWNQLDIFIVILSIIGIIFDTLTTEAQIPVNPTIIRVMRVLRIARVLKLLKMAKGIRALLDTVIQALPQVGNLGLLFFLLFFIFAILGVELFGKLNCDSIKHSCDGISKHAHFHNFGMSFLTLFRIATGDNWNSIMKDTLRENVLCQDETSQPGTTNSVCLASILAPIYFVIFVLMAQFVLVNVVVAVLMKHLDDSNKMMADDAEMDEEIEKQLEEEARNNINNDQAIKMDDDFENENFKPLTKQTSLPPNFTFNLPSDVQTFPADRNDDSTIIKPIKNLFRTSSVKVPSFRNRKNSFRKQTSVNETTTTATTTATKSAITPLINVEKILTTNKNEKKPINDLLEERRSLLTTKSNEQQQQQNENENSIDSIRNTKSILLKNPNENERSKENNSNNSSNNNNNNNNNNDIKKSLSSNSIKSNNTNNVNSNDSNTNYSNNNNNSNTNDNMKNSHFTSPPTPIKINVIDDTDNENDIAKP